MLEEVILMFPGPVKSGLTLTKVLGGIGKTLNVANQIIPIYMQAKPLISNARSTFAVAKEILSTPKASSSQTTKTTASTPQKEKIVIQKKESTPILSTNKPVFFL